MTPCAITFTSDTSIPEMDALKHSCKAWGWELFIIEREWRGFGNRLKAVLSFAAGLRGFTHAVHVDAFDVIAIGPPTELEAAIAFYDYPPLLVACEAAVWPNSEDIRRRYGECRSPWWFAHSQFVLDLNKPRPPGFGNLSEDADDQQHLHNLWLAQTPGMVLDRQCRVVQSIAHANPWGGWFAVDDDRIRNCITGSLPLFAHGNGKTDMSWVPQRSVHQQEPQP